jgi:signal-transduction protein with cAMP-binding, CBS, and nucleotidyltransferase domain
MTMNSFEALLLLRRPGLTYRDAASVGDWAKVLATLDLFEGVSRRGLRKLVRSGSVLDVPAGDAVVAVDRAPEWIYVILGGTARSLGEGRTRALSVGDVVGTGLLLERRAAAAAAIASEDLLVLKLPRRRFVRHAGAVAVPSRDIRARLRPQRTQAARCPS